MSRYLFLLLASIIFLSIYSCNNSDPVSGNGGLANFSQIDHGASWSQDESKILFIRRLSDIKTSGIFILDYSTLNFQMLVNGILSYPDWSFDARKIIYTQIGNLYMINLPGDTLNLFIPGGLVKSASWKWNPDWILLTLGQMPSNGFELNLYNPTTKEILSLDEKGFEPSWNFDGEKIVYLKPFFDNNGIQDGDSLMMFETGSNRKTFIKELRQPFNKISSFPKFFNNKIYFSSTDVDGKTFIYRINLDGSDLTKIITTQSYSPDVSQSGKLVYTNREPGNGLLWELNLNTGVNRQITH